MTALSYSAISTADKCPQKYYRHYVLMDRKPMPSREEAPALHRGLDAHQETEDFLLGKRDDVTIDCLKHYEGWFSTLRDTGKCQPELEWNYDPHWKPLDFKDKENGLIRGVTDLVMIFDDIGHVKEWKTGQMYPEHDMQRNIYGLTTLLAFPEIKEVHVDTVYFDLQENKKVVYPRNMLGSYKWLWERKCKTINALQDFPMRPSWKCRFCPYSKEHNGGTCPN